MIEYPYMISNGKLPQIFEKIQSAATPEAFSYVFFKKLGFSSSNDRAFIPLAKRLDLLHQDGAPTEYYNRIKNKTEFAQVLAGRIKNLYNDIYSIDTEIHDAQPAEIKGAMVRVTGKDEKSVDRYYKTFKALTQLADFKSSPLTLSKTDVTGEKKEEKKSDEKEQNYPKNPLVRQEMVNFHYNIQIHLPATTDIKIYNAIFKSIKENLTDE